MFLNTHHRTPRHRSRSRSCSRAPPPRPGCPGSGSTTCDTPTPRLLVAAGVPIKVVSERLGHAHPGFTMHTYQHLLPGMGAAAATQFADLIDTSR
jgi:integrase